MLLSGFIFYEGYHRLKAPREVSEGIMIAVAAAGLAVNLGIMLGLRSASRNDLNIRSASVHMMGDAVSSVGIMGGGILIVWTGRQWIDPALSILIGGLILWTARGIIKESLNILLEGLPRGLRLETVIESLRRVPGVIDVHDVHIWSLASHTHALSCHVMIEDLPPSASESILRSLNEMLERSFQISHTTIQFENVLCEISGSGCAAGRNRARC